MRTPDEAVLQRPVREAQAARELIEAGWRALQQRALTFRSPPSEPTTCCGRGCQGCVWEGYVDAVEYWRIDLMACLTQAQPEHDVNGAPEATPSSGRECLTLDCQTLF